MTSRGPRRAILIASRHDDSDWRDLRVCLTSIDAYVPEHVEVFVATRKDLRGLRPMQSSNPQQGLRKMWIGSQFKRFHFDPQPDSCTTFGAAYEFVHQRAKNHSQFDEYVVCNDDVVFTPYTWGALMHGVDDAYNKLRSHSIETRLGFVATQTNYVRPGLQQYVQESPLTEPEFTICVSLVLAWAQAETLDRISWPHCNWFSDDLMCHDLVQLGYVHAVVPSYVHHVGERGTYLGDSARAMQEGMAFLKEHRPDYLAALQPYLQS